MKAVLCDICKQPKTDYKIQYKAEKKAYSHIMFGTVWEDIDICEECLKKIIKAKDREAADK
jgi:hypothetical protein